MVLLDIRSIGHRIPTYQRYNQIDAIKILKGDSTKVI